MEEVKSPRSRNLQKTNKSTGNLTNI